MDTDHGERKTMMKRLVAVGVGSLLALSGSLGSAQARPVGVCYGQKATIVGTEGADVIVGTSGPDVIDALGGDDVIRGLAGGDHICAGDGADKITPGRGNDSVSGEWPTDRTADPAHGDLVSYADGPAVIVNMRYKQVSGWGFDRLSNIEIIEGSGADDLLQGSLREQVFYGGAGNDVIRAQGDTAYGGPGNDIIKSGEVYGGPGNDLLEGLIISYLNAEGAIAADLSAGTATGEGEDRLLIPNGDPIVTLIASAFDDILTGGEGNEVLLGGPGVDELYGLAGNDSLDGGGPGDKPGDLLDGGDGSDQCAHGERVSNCES